MSKAKPTLRIGTATADITPKLGIQLAGDIGRTRPTEEIRERLYAKAVSFEYGKTRFVLVVMDLCTFSNKYSDIIRKRASERTGIPVEAIALMATQTHAAPAMGNDFIRDSCPLMPAEYPWLRGSVDEYNIPAAEAIAGAIVEATRAHKPVTLSYGRGVDGRGSFNRRFVMRDGTSVCHPPLAGPNIAHVEGPTDPEVGVMRFNDETGNPLAIFLHHTCHPCHGYPHRYTLADWPGVWADLVRQRMPGDPTAMVFNGCCGNIHHSNHLDPTWKNDHVRMATQLDETTGRVLEKLAPSAVTPVAFKRTVIKLPMRRVPPKELAAAKKLIKANPDPIWLDAEKTRVSWDWVYAVSRIDLDAWVREDKTFDYEIQAFRIGDTAIVTLMGEPFVECQLAIKAASPAKLTIVVHMANGYAGYTPTAEALKRGGYETRTAVWSKFQPEALGMIEKSATKLLASLF